VQELSDGQMFWVIRNGVRMTGMPALGKTHTNEEDLAHRNVCATRADITDAELASLRSVPQSEAHSTRENRVGVCAASGREGWRDGPTRRQPSTRAQGLVTSSGAKPPGHRCSLATLLAHDVASRRSPEKRREPC